MIRESKGQARARCSTLEPTPISNFQSPVLGSRISVPKSGRIPPQNKTAFRLILALKKPILNEFSEPLSCFHHRDSSSSPPPTKAPPIRQGSCKELPPRQGWRPEFHHQSCNAPATPFPSPLRRRRRPRRGRVQVTTSLVRWRCRPGPACACRLGTSAIATPSTQRP